MMRSMTVLMMTMMTVLMMTMITVLMMWMTMRIQNETLAYASDG